MFSSYDLGRFGTLVKEKRKKCRLSQKTISELTGVHVDTLRRIENGFVIPKYETLELLSSYYKTDLLLLLQSTRSDSALESLYHHMDRIIVSNRIGELDQLAMEFIEIKERHQTEKSLINYQELDQFEAFIQATRLFHAGGEACCQEAQLILVKALEGIDTSVELPDYEVFNFLEIRLLMLLAPIKMEFSQYDECLNILNHVLTILKNEFFTDQEIVKMIIKIYFNISYCHHCADRDIEALDAADKGILYANEHYSSYGLYLLYARKAVAQMLIYRRKSIADYEAKNEEALDSFAKCRHILEITGQEELLKKYQEVFLRNYGIDLYELN